MAIKECLIEVKGSYILEYEPAHEILVLPALSSN